MQDRAARLAWFKSIVLPHEAALRRHVRRLAKHDLDTDDIVAEVLTRAYTATDFARVERGRSFLFTIARNLLTDIARRQAVASFDLVADVDQLNVVDEAPSMEAVISGRDGLRRLQRLVEELPPQCRRVFVLRRVEELSLHQIADQLQLSVSTVEKHLSRAMVLLTEAWPRAEAPSRSRKDRYGPA